MQNEAMQGKASETEVIGLKDAGVRLRSSYSTVLRLVKSGDLEAFRVRSSWKTTTAACDRYIARQLAEQRMICMSVEVDE